MPAINEVVLDPKAETAQRLIPIVEKLRQGALDLELEYESEIDRIDPDYQASARNLLHYVAVRRKDLRPVQRELVGLGITSLGKAESHILATLDNVLQLLHCLADEEWSQPDYEVSHATCITGPQMLEQHALRLLGEPAGKRRERIMVTMPSEAATDPDFVRDLLAAGMDVMRINSAHDDQDAWIAMIKYLHAAELELGRSCKIYADLAGPKLRTGPIAPVGKILKFRPQRDHCGKVRKPAYVWFTPADAPEPPPPNVTATIPITNGLLERASAGDILFLKDCRDRRRRMHITMVDGSSVLAESYRTAYVETGMSIRLLHDGDRISEGQIGELPDLILPIILNEGDKLILMRTPTAGRSAYVDKTGKVVEPAHISCTLPEIFEMVKPGERIRFDDGKIEGRILSNDHSQLEIEITRTGLKGGRLRAEKGINFPDSELTMPSLTEKDRQDLSFLVDHVDMFGLSFVRDVDDIASLEVELEKHDATDVGIVLKIENRRAFENLPSLLLASLRTPPDGVMLARGDLAAEVGFLRMAEVQKEILWLCEAAHMPVIWATQVLEGLAKTGSPSRAEVTDVVTGGLAECVMLNKGPFITEAVNFLDDTLERMDAHRSKRRTMLRRLAVSENIT